MAASTLTTASNVGDGPGRQPPKECVVILPVWGSAFVRRFLELCLPSLLAAGNVPALAQALPTRFVLLTRSADISAIAGHSTWKRLAQICATEIQTLDELITRGNHHATVTLAYARVMRGVGDLRDALFVFLVGDFIVAERSLSAVLQRIQSGTSGLLAGHLQVSIDDAERFVKTCFHDHKDGFSLAHRPLVKWALAHLHPSCAASIVNTSLLHQSDVNRLFWAVDSDTLIGRFYLLHMIAIHPEVSDFVVDGPCDYAFIPELCPSGRVDALADSDDYFVVEPQSFHQGIEALRWGRMTTSQLALELSRWTTADHRQNASRTLVFHAGDIPEELSNSIAEASVFIGEVNRAMSPQPKPHRNHPTWTAMMALQRAGGGLAPGDSDWARLFGAQTSNHAKGGWLWSLRLKVLGHPPNVTMFHPQWLDFQLARNLMKAHLNASDRLLLISAAPRAVERWLAPLGAAIVSIDTDETAEFFKRQASSSAGSFDRCLWVVSDALISQQATLRCIRRALRPGGYLVIFAIEELDCVRKTIPAFCANASLALRQYGFQGDDCHYVPVGPVRIALHRALTRMMRAGRQSSAILRLPIIALSALLAFFVLVYNSCVWSLRRIRPPRRNCSSALLAARLPPT